MRGPDLPDANDPAGIARDAAGRVVRAVTTGISDAVGKERELISETRASAGMFLRAERDAAIPIDASARALISNDQVYGGRREDAYTAWFGELRDRGVDTDRALSDLGKLWDYLRYDPKWEIDPARNYGGIIFFGSKDIGGASVVANLVRDHGLGDVPVVFSGSNGEAAKFRLAAEKMGLDSRQIIEEPKAANTGQNAVFSTQMLADHGRDISSLIGVCTPFHARRVWATVMQQGIADVNGKRVSVDHVAMGTADVSLENYMKYGNRPDADTAPHPKSIVAVTMGEIKRLDEYPAEGHIVRQDIPGEVRDAYDRLSETFRPAERRY
ncbi:YdcF family protein [Nocardia carnea]|uniref:YdcF family protein n=1 Tax=Nocardia carnea TaxID=37328 RepID=UPI0024589FCC|nr:YdcF family protein [Nocardia carnea]